VTRRYRFGDFVLSPRRRALVRGGAEQPLIPRYFDLLVFLVAHRHEAVHRRDIFDRVWSDVVVSDSALSQAIRTIRRVLEDDPRDPRFIRTVSRHGYQFVFDQVIEEEDDGSWPVAVEVVAADTESQVPVAAVAAPLLAHADPIASLLARLSDSAVAEEERREAAELLHQIGTAEVLTRLDRRPGHAAARALLRDTRWAVPGAGPVPIIGAPGALASATALVALRWRRAARIAAGRGVSALLGGAVAGLGAGVVGGLLLWWLPESRAPLALTGVLGAIGGLCGAVGAAGVGGGISMAEVEALSRRRLGLIVGASIGGGLAGGLTQWIAQGALSSLVGVPVSVGGGVEGLAIGAAAGIGYAVATSGAQGGLAAPRGRDRWRAVAWIAGATAVAALLLTLSGRPLVGGTIHRIAEASSGSQAALTPLGRLVGEPDFGPLTRALLGAGEGATFGFGLAIGLTRRRRG
jgi:DNA-binding winged helix-turn-helix (wHTH) protein